MRRLRIYADFNGLRISPRNHARYAVALDTFGSLPDLSNAGIRLTEEMPLVIFDWSDENEDLEGHCTVYYDWQRQCWWAELDEQGVLDVPRDERKPVKELSLKSHPRLYFPLRSMSSFAPIKRSPLA